jgi:hypothetical protein
MDGLFITHGAGLDMHKKVIVATVLTPTVTETRTFGTLTEDLLTLGDWLLARGGGHPRGHGSDRGVLETRREFVRGARLRGGLGGEPQPYQRHAAWTFGAITRLRAIQSAEALLRLILAYAWNDWSLRTTAAWARRSGLADVSDVAALK